MEAPQEPEELDTTYTFTSLFVSRCVALPFSNPWCLSLEHYTHLDVEEQQQPEEHFNLDTKKIQYPSGKACI